MQAKATVLDFKGISRTLSYKNFLLKPIACILFLLLFCLPGFSQYYLRGEIKDENNKPLSNVKILLHSTGYVYYSGNSGSFGIVSPKTIDSITVTMDGFQQTSFQLNSKQYEQLTLKMLATGNIRQRKLMSFTKDLKFDRRGNWHSRGETYSNLVENDFLEAKSYAETGFAISIDKASYSNVRRFVNMQSVVPPDAVRIEELLNYFNFGYVSPVKDSVFSFDTHLTGCPWNANNQLLFLKVCAKKLDLDAVPPSNLVFLVDVSGSMDMPNRLPLLKSAFSLMVNNLRDKDTVSIVVYGSAIGVMLPPTSGKEKDKIRKAIEDLYPGGATPGESGIRQAYRLAQSRFIPGGNNRVILATDGDFNVGQTNEDELEQMIAQHRQLGIYLTCLGVGMGNYKDSKLEVLAKKGNGNFAYLDNEKEAEKVLVKELTQTLYTVADDAYCTIRFNSRYVKEYRLIGFDNKQNAMKDSTSELEGGEVGSGHTLVAVVEIVPTAVNEQKVNEDRFTNESIAKVMINYRLPKDSTRRNMQFTCPMQFTQFDNLPACQRFATSIVMFASLLKESKYAKAIRWNDVIILANQSYNVTDPLQTEFLQLVEKAKKIYIKGRKKKRGGS